VRASGVTDRPFLAYDFQLPSTGWAFVWWEYDDDGFYHRAISWDGTTRRGWQDGVRDDDVGTASGPGTNNFLRPIVTDGIARLVRAGSAAFQVGPVLGLQFCPSNAQMAQLTQHIQPFGPMPALRLEGDMIGEEWVHVRPTPLRSDFFLLYDSSGRRNNVRLIEFDLAEVVVQDVRGSRVFGIASTQPDQGPYQQEDELEPSSFGDMIYISNLSSGQSWTYGGVEVISAAVTTLPRVGVVVADEETGNFKFALVANLVADSSATNLTITPSLGLVNNRLWLILQTVRRTTSAPQSQIQLVGPHNTVTLAAGSISSYGPQTLAFEIDINTGTILNAKPVAENSSPGVFTEVPEGDMPARHWLETNNGEMQFISMSHQSGPAVWSSTYTEPAINSFGRIIRSARLDSNAALTNAAAPRLQMQFPQYSTAGSAAAGVNAISAGLPILMASPEPRLIENNSYMAYQYRGSAGGNLDSSNNQDTGGSSTVVNYTNGRSGSWLLSKMASNNEVIWQACLGGMPGAPILPIAGVGAGIVPLLDGGVMLLAYGYGLAYPYPGTMRFQPGVGSEVEVIQNNQAKIALWCLNSDGTHRWLKVHTATASSLGIYGFALEQTEHNSFIYGMEGFRNWASPSDANITIGVGEVYEKTTLALGEMTASAFHRQRYFLTKRSLADGSLATLPPVISSPLATFCYFGSAVIRNNELCIITVSNSDINIDIGSIVIPPTPTKHKRLRFHPDTLEYLGHVDLPDTSLATLWGGPLLTLPSGS
jgi:hypothetical protein